MLYLINMVKETLSFLSADCFYIGLIIFSMDSIPSSVRLYFIFNTYHYKVYH